MHLLISSAMKGAAVIVIIALLLLPLAADAQQPRPAIVHGSKIFVEEMDHDLDGYIRAEIIKQRVPVVIVLKAEDADYILKSTATEKEKRKWHEGWLTVERDKTSGNIFLIEIKIGTLVWAWETGNRSTMTWWGALKRGGHRKAAGRLVNNLKKAIDK